MDNIIKNNVLSRKEMKLIKGGSANCQLCDDGRMIYKDFDGSDPEDGCSWGTCPVIHP